MYNNLSYDVEFTPRKNKTKYWAEREAAHEFLATGYNNACLEYDNARDVKNAYQSLLTYVREARQPLTLAVRGNCLIITRNQKETAQEN